MSPIPIGGLEHQVAQLVVLVLQLELERIEPGGGHVHHLVELHPHFDELLQHRGLEGADVLADLAYLFKDKLRLRFLPRAEKVAQCRGQAHERDAQPEAGRGAGGQGGRGHAQLQPGVDHGPGGLHRSVLAADCQEKPVEREVRRKFVPQLPDSLLGGLPGNLRVDRLDEKLGRLLDLQAEFLHPGTNVLGGFQDVVKPALDADQLERVLGLRVLAQPLGQRVVEAHLVRAAEQGGQGVARLAVLAPQLEGVQDRLGPLDQGVLAAPGCRPLLEKLLPDHQRQSVLEGIILPRRLADGDLQQAEHVGRADALARRDADRHGTEFLEVLDAVVEGLFADRAVVPVPGLDHGVGQPAGGGGVKVGPELVQLGEEGDPDPRPGVVVSNEVQVGDVGLSRHLVGRRRVGRLRPHAVGLDEQGDGEAERDGSGGRESHSSLGHGRVLCGRTFQSRADPPWAVFVRRPVQTAPAAFSIGASVGAKSEDIGRSRKVLVKGRARRSGRSC
jgi:hypothetical protein